MIAFVSSAESMARIWRGRHTDRMWSTHAVAGIDELPVYLIAEEDPGEVSEEQFLSGVALSDLLASMPAGLRLYLVDYASTPGRTRLTRLA